MSDLPIDVDAEAIFLDGTWYTREDLSRRIKAMLDSGDFNVARPSAALEALTQALRTVRTLSFRCTAEVGDALNETAARLGKSVGAVIRDAVTEYLIEGGVKLGKPAAAPVPPPSRPASGASPAVPPPGTPSRPVTGSVPVLAPAPPPQPAPPQLAPAAPAASSGSFNSLPVVIDVDDEEPQQQEPTGRWAMPVAPPGTTQDDLPKVIVEEQPMVIAGPGALANAGVGQKPLELTQPKKPADGKPDEAVSSEHRWFKQ